VFLLGVFVIVGGQASAGQKPPAAAASSRDSEQKQPAVTKAADQAFMIGAAMSSMAEVEHGRLAAQNAAADDVKRFGQQMVDDHTKANGELQGLAAQKKVTLPTELDQRHQAMQNRLSKLKGAAFDKAYMAHMVTAHQQAVSLFQREVKSGKDADAQAWAKKTLPTLEEHHKMAADLNSRVGKKLAGAK
jgi:putative membrane protein